MPGEGREVEVVHDLAEQVVDRLRQQHAGLVVAGDPEAVQHLLAETVCRGDGRPVEVRQRPDQTLSAQCLLGRGHVAQVTHKGVLAGRVEHAACGGREPFAHPLAELLGRGAAEGGEQQLGQLGASFCDVARGESRDGPGLPGAGAGLQHGRPGRQRAVEVEAHGAPTDSWASSGAHSRTASAPKRVPSAPGSGSAVNASKPDDPPWT